MMIRTQPLVERYLLDLQRALRDLPRSRRREIVDEIREHIDEALSASSKEADEAEIRTILDQVGDPEFIAEEAKERFAIPHARVGALEAAAIAMLLVGGIVILGVGWIIGVVLLWMSSSWTVRDKLIGTLVVPGGLGLPLYLLLIAPFSVSTCIETRSGSDSAPIGVENGTDVVACSTQSAMSEWWAIALIVILVVAPIATAIYLGQRAWAGRVSQS